MSPLYPRRSRSGENCPDDSGGLTSEGSAAKNTGYYVNYQNLTAADDTSYGSYAINASDYAAASNIRGPAVSNVPTPMLSTLANPATTVWVTDGNGAFSFAWANPGDVMTTSTIGGYTSLGHTGLNEGSIIVRHGGPDLVNVLYCDGHVKSQHIAALMQKDPTNTYFLPVDYRRAVNQPIGMRKFDNQAGVAANAAVTGLLVAIDIKSCSSRCYASL